MDHRTQIMHKAIELLARREHSRYELKHKLSRYDFEQSLIESVLDELVERDYLNDQRYAEQWMQQRLEKGYGPYQIQAGVIKKGVEFELANRILEEWNVDWHDHLLQIYLAKYSNRAVGDDHEQAKRARFLSYRGFSSEMIHALLWGNTYH